MPGPHGNTAGKGGMTILAVLNHKGGVGKTTTAVNTGAALAALGKRILLADLDPQAHLTYSLGIMAHELPRSLADCLRRTVAPQDVLIRKDALAVLPAGMALSALERDFAGKAGNERTLGSVLEQVEGFDLALLDCPPNLGPLTLNALTAAHALLVPAQPEFLAMHSMGMLKLTVDIVQERLNPGLCAQYVVFTRFQKNRRLHREVLASTKRHYGDAVLSCVIRENISLAEAPSFGRDIFHYKPDSTGARDYLSLAGELLRRMES